MELIGTVRSYNVYKDIHGVIYISNRRYFGHSKTSAIAAFRKLFKKSI